MKYLFACMFALVLASGLTTVTCFPPARPPSGAQPDFEEIQTRPKRRTKQEQTQQELQNKKCQDFYNSTNYVYEPVLNVCVRCTVCLDSMEPYCQACKSACSSNPCANGATCVEAQGLYSCNCDIGWEGVHCNVDFDECLSIPCRNGGTCINNLAHFVCHCMPDFEGLVCEIEQSSTVPNLTDTPEGSSDSNRSNTTDYQPIPESDGMVTDGKKTTIVSPTVKQEEPWSIWNILMVVALVIIIIIGLGCVCCLIKRSLKRATIATPAVTARNFPHEEEPCLDDNGGGNIDVDLPKPRQDTEPVPPFHPMESNSYSSSLESNTSGDFFAESQL